MYFAVKMFPRLLRPGLHAHDLAALAFHHHFKRPAADLAIHREPLAAGAGVDDHLARLTAERALDVRKFFHAGNLTVNRQSAMRQNPVLADGHHGE